MDSNADRETRFRAMVESQSEFIVCWLPDGTRTYVNEAYARYFGVSRKECVGTSFFPLIASDEERRTVRDKINSLTAQNPVAVDVHQAMRHDGMMRWQEWTDHAFFDERGGMIELQSVGRDIHEQRLAEESAKASQQMLQMIIDNIPQGVFWKDRHSRYLGCNRVVLEAFGIGSLKDILGKTDRDLGCLSREQSEYFILKDCEVMESNRPQFGIVEPATLANGRTIWMETNKIPMHDASGKVVGILGTWQDITQRKRNEEELRETQSNLEKALTAGRMGIWISDLVRRGALTWSDETCRIFGSSPTVFDGKLATFLDSVHPKDLECVQTASRKAISETGHYQIEHRIVHKDGSVHWVREQAEVESDAQGNPERLLGIVQDITEFKEAEQAIRHLQKMESIGQLASGVAHDFNNILTVIRGNASLLNDEIDESSREGEAVNEIVSAAEKATHLTRQLLLFSRKEEIHLQSVNLNETVRGVAKLLNRILGENIELDLLFEDEPPLIQGDRGMLEQVIMNLAINARDAMPGGGKIVLSTSSAHLSQEDVSRHPEARPGSHACLQIQDSGAGIHPDILPRIFDPFFTTKEIGKGTGLGLATVYGIVQQHQGWIEVFSRPQSGTVFRIFLPVSQGAAAVEESDTAHFRKKGGSETVLLVEDEPSVLKLAQRLLDRAGYRVFEARSAQEALETYDQHHLEIDLLLTDIVMPGGVNGIELGQKLLDRNPSLKIVYTSGYFQTDAQGPVRLIEGENYLRKPYASKSLLEIISQRLDAD